MIVHVLEIVRDVADGTKCAAEILVVIGDFAVNFASGFVAVGVLDSAGIVIRDTIETTLSRFGESAVFVLESTYSPSHSEDAVVIKRFILHFEFSHSFRKSVAALIRNSSSSITRLVASVTPELVGGSKSSLTLRYI